MPPFSGTSGLHVSAECHAPIDFFNEIVTAEFLDSTVQETNRYAQENLQARGELKRRSLFRQWPNDGISVNDLVGFLVICVYMGVVHKPEVKDYWSKKPMLTSPFAPGIMGRDKFNLILAMLHVSNNADYIPVGQGGHDPLQKIRPVYTHLQEKFAALYTPQENICVDEAICPWRGKSKFRVYMKDKPTKWGIKLYELCESESGYVHNFEIFAAEPGVSNRPVDVVMRLCEPLLGEGRSVYVDNYYACPELAEALVARDTHCVGTVRANRKGMPPQLKTQQLPQRGHVQAYRQAEKDMLLLGMLACTPMNNSEMTVGKLCRQKTREHQRTTYTVNFKIVCRESFKFIYGISQNKLTALLKHYLEHGLTPRQKKSGGRKFNTNAIDPVDVERVVRFITNFAEDHGLVLPGRVPGFRRTDIKILPSAHTKASIWRHYQAIAGARGHRMLGKTSFFKIWEQHLPFIVVGKPMTDLCWQCKQNNEKIRRSAGLPEEERGARLRDQLAHLDVVEAERRFYNRQVDYSKAATAAANITELGPHPANSWPAKMHYSFDFAQQVHLPNSPLQPGPIYFLVPRKCGIFGVCCEGLPQQINYLIDEGMSSSKGSNMVLSLLHHFFNHFGLGEMEVDLHCDNCSGQNKNKFMLWYLAWRVMQGLHTSITINFMPAGHTKFAPDWCFGLLKRRFKRCEVHCLDDLCDVINSSTTKGINRAQIIGTEAGEEKVIVYDWQTFFYTYFKAVKGMKKYFHFRFSSDAPGTVYVKTTLSAEEEQIQVAYCVDTARRRLVGLPARIQPPGLPADRRDYLRQHIRPFVKPDAQDILCP